MSETAEYNDDRMFLLAVYPARLVKDAEENHQTAVFYDQKPEPCLWAVLTIQNTPDYPLVGINHFETEEQARTYKIGLERWGPLHSLGGRSPTAPMSIEDYKAWKEENRLSDFDPTKVPRLDVENRIELVTQTKEQFVAGLQQVAAVVQGRPS